MAWSPPSKVVGGETFVESDFAPFSFAATWDRFLDALGTNLNDVNNAVATVRQREVRALPPNVNDCVLVGTWDAPHGAHSILVGVTVNASGFSVSKNYFLATFSNATGGAWQDAVPLYECPPFTGDTFDLEVRQGDGSFARRIQMRVRRVSGTVAANVVVTMQHLGAAGATFTPESTVQSAQALPTAALATSRIYAGAFRSALRAIDSTTPAADRLPFFTGTTTAALATLTPFARTILDDPDAGTVRATIGAQPADGTLSALAALDGAPGYLRQTGPDSFVKDVVTPIGQAINAIEYPYPSLGSPTLVPFTSFHIRHLDWPLEAFGSVDRTGTTDMSSLINLAIAHTAGNMDRLFLPPGIYRVNSPLRLQNNTKLFLDRDAEIVAHNNTTGSGAILMGAVGFNQTTNVLQNIRIEGGQWRRNGVLSGTHNETWIGNTGNVFCFHAHDCVIRDVWMTGYQSGRAMLIGGDNWLVENCHVRNKAWPDQRATPEGGGTGAFRVYSGNNMLLRNLTAVCGDDCFQIVPGETLADSIDIRYENCWGYSIIARVIIIGLGDRTESYVHQNVFGAVFRGIRGKSPFPVGISNTESSGKLHVLVEDCSFDQTPVPVHRPGANSSFAVNVAGGNPADGETRITMRNIEVKTVINGAFIASGAKIEELTIDGWRSAPPTNPLSTRGAFTVWDADVFRLRNFEIWGRGALGAQNVVTLGRADAATELKRVVMEDGVIHAIPDLSNGIAGTVNGFLDGTFNRITMFPHTGVTTAAAIRASDITERIRVMDCDFSALASNPFSNLPSDYKITDTKFNGTDFLSQTLPAAATVVWNGSNRHVRISSSAPTTINTIDFPPGYTFYDIPIITLIGGNNHTITLTNAGNLALRNAASSITLTLRDSVQFVWDPPFAKWIQLGEVVAT